MPRDKTFSEAEAAGQAAAVFAAHGYLGTSLAQLEAATGLGRQSLYNAFGDKAALYRRAVDEATARIAPLARRMQAAPTGRAAVEDFFAALRDDCLSGEPARARCIVTCGLLEGLDDAAHAHLEHKWLATHELLRAQVERGQRDGSIRSLQPSALLADRLMLLLGGLRVMARIRPASDRVASAIEHARSLLDH